MAHEITWTIGAEADLQALYEQVDDHDLSLRILHQPLEHILSLLAEFPNIGARVRGTQRVRRVLTGPKMRYGLFYVEEARRIMIHALVDMRHDPKALQTRLSGM